MIVFIPCSFWCDLFTMQREQLQMLNNQMENAFFSEVLHELLHWSQRPFYGLHKNTILMGQTPRKKKFHILMLGHLVRLLVWKQKTQKIWHIHQTASVSPSLQYSLGVFHRPPLHIVVEVLHVLQPLSKDCCGVINIVVSGRPGKMRAQRKPVNTRFRSFAFSQLVNESSRGRTYLS